MQSTGALASGVHADGVSPTSGVNADGVSPAPPRCNCGRALKHLLVRGATLTCDGCNAAIRAGSQAWSCAACDHDLCGACSTEVTGGGAMGGGGALVKLEDVGIGEDGVPRALTVETELALGGSGDVASSAGGPACAPDEDELYANVGGSVSEAASSSDAYNARWRGDDEQAEPEQELFCPLSHTLLTEAVMTSSGHLFNEGALRQWLELHPGEDPLTRQPISDHVFPAIAVRTMAERWAARGGI